MKAIVCFLATLLATSAAADKRNVGPALPQKADDKDDPLSLENLLDPGKPVPEILPAPDALPNPPSSKKSSASSAKAELIAAANDYRQKTALFRKGKLSREALRESAIRVAQAAKTYRAALRR